MTDTQRVMLELFGSCFDRRGDALRFRGGLLSAHSLIKLKLGVNRFAAEFEEVTTTTRSYLSRAEADRVNTF